MENDRLTITRFKARPEGYGCSLPDDRSGEYVPLVEVKALTAERDQLRSEALRFYRPDGSFEVLPDREAVVARRIEAAGAIERLERLNADKFNHLNAYRKAADEDRATIGALTAERDRLREAAAWVVNDIAYAAPELAAARRADWYGRLKDALEPEGSVTR